MAAAAFFSKDDLASCRRLAEVGGVQFAQQTPIAATAALRPAPKKKRSTAQHGLFLKHRPSEMSPRQMSELARETTEVDAGGY